MGYQRGDNRYGAERGREQGRGRYGDHGRDHGDRWSRDEDDRGFFERASDEVRSWFHDDDDDHGRRAERERGWGAEHRDRGQDRWRDTAGWGGGGDWREGRSGSGSRYGTRGSADAQDGWGGSGFGGDYDRGRRFDRGDAGGSSYGGQSMSSQVGGAYGSSYGASVRDSASSGRSQPYSGGGAGGLHDPHYAEWRNRQIEALDRDYEDYRRENQSRFEQEFGGWREKRQGQRQALGRASEGMEVVGSDGQHIGTVDKVRGDRIILTKSDPNAGGHHHSIPCGWVDKVEDKVMINKTLEEATRQWRDEETSRALFERDDQGSEGPHALDRAFKGTY